MWRSKLAIPIGVVRIRFSGAVCSLGSLRGSVSGKPKAMRAWVRTGALVGVIVAVVVLFHYVVSPSLPVLATRKGSGASLKNQYDVWPPFSVKPKHKSEWYFNECFGGKLTEDVEIAFGPNLEIWAQSTHQDCIDVYHKFRDLYEVHDRYSTKLSVPEKFQERINGWLNHKQDLIDQVHHQHLIHVFHPLTGEHAVYNPIRAKRPMPTHAMDLFKWVDELAANTSKECDFCQYMDFTAVDEFGRDDEHLQTTARVTNTFKVEAWHSMIVTRHLHHPLKFTRALMRKFFSGAMTWVYQVTQKDPDYIYSNIAWDTLHHAGASQIHPHIHMMISPDHYYGSFEVMRSAAQRYYSARGENYFNSVLEVHRALGLVVEFEDAVAFPMITGKADLEIMFLSDIPTSAFYDLIFFAINAYHDTFTQLCKSMAAAYPALGTSEDAFKGRIPAVARLISRGDCTSLRTDYSTYEIFQIVYRNHDPWQVAAALRAAVKKYEGSSKGFKTLVA